jgi:hypothetical protein
MKNDFASILLFLEACGPEVLGHGRANAPLDDPKLLNRFIGGHCSDKERQEVCEFLQNHPAWIRWVADRIKLVREEEAAQQATEA